MHLIGAASKRNAGRVCGILAVALLVAATLLTPVRATTPASASSPDRYYVEATGHALADPFLSFWISNDGRESLGFPVTDVVARGAHSAQYFEFGAIVRRSTGLLTRLKIGQELLDLQHRPDEVAGNLRRSGSGPSRMAFAPVARPLDAAAGSVASAFQVAPAFASYYESGPGTARLGRPLSNAYTYSGKTVQWFEYGRLELFNDRVSQAEVGFELAQTLGFDTSPGINDGIPLFDPNRYRDFAGDGTIPEAQRVFAPVRIWIPSIRINATIEQVAIENRVMGVPKNAWNVGWYPSISSPGEWTNVVMAGHRDWWGLGPVVFWNLSKLVDGDKIYVLGADGAGYTYEVTRSWVVDATIDATSLIEDTGTESLTLITCDGFFNGTEYTSRRIVRAERI